MKFSSGSQGFLRINVIKHDIIVFKKIRMKYVIKIMHIHSIFTLNFCLSSTYVIDYFSRNNVLKFFCFILLLRQ